MGESARQGDQRSRAHPGLRHERVRGCAESLKTIPRERQNAPGRTPEMSAGLRFHLSRLLINFCFFSRSGGTETELADFGPPVRLQSLPIPAADVDRKSTRLNSSH